MRRLLARLIAVLIFATIFAPAAASASQTDPRLNDLFAKLRATSNADEAKIVELSIWQIWSESGDPATDSLMELGVTAMQGHDLSGALGLFNAITERSPDFAEGWNKRATVLFMMGQPEQAAEDVARVLSLEPRHFGALAGLGLIDMELHRDNDAIAAFQQALRINPNMPDAKAHLEELLNKRNKGAI